MTAHIKLKKEFAETKIKNILAKIKELINTHFDIEHTTIEFD